MINFEPLFYNIFYLKDFTDKLASIRKEFIVRKRIMKEKVNWLILGAGNIAHRFAASLFKHPQANLYAIAGRDEEKLKTFAKEFPCEKIYTDFNEALKDPNVDAVYIALPHKLHSKWILNAMEQKKACLCEKPMVLHPEEMKEIMDMHSKYPVLVMEAMKTKFIPGYTAIQNLLETKDFGTIKTIKTAFCYELDENSRKNPNKYINQKDQGGALYDVGCYQTGFYQGLVKDPAVFENVEFKINENGADDWFKARLKTKDTDIYLEGATDRNKSKEGMIECEKGRIEADIFYRPQKIKYTLNSEEFVLDVPYQIDDFYSQIDAFIKAYLNNETEEKSMTLSDSYASVMILDTIKRHMNQ